MNSIQFAVLTVYGCFCLLLPILVSFLVGRALYRRELEGNKSRRLSIKMMITCVVSFVAVAFWGIIISAYASIAIGCIFEPGPDCEHVFAEKPML